MNTVFAEDFVGNEITGAVAFNTTEVAKHWESLSSSKPTKFMVEDPDVAITQIWINVAQKTESSGMTLRQLPYQPVTTTLLEAQGYRYYEIKTSNILKSNTLVSKIIFSVERRWLDENGIDSNSLVLKMFKDVDWIALPTVKTGAGSDAQIEYSADTTEFLQYFAIAGIKKPVSVAPIPVEKSTEPVAAAPISEQPARQWDISIISLIAVVILLVVLLVVVLSQKKSIHPVRKRRR